MGRVTTTVRKTSKDRAEHPIWRGIGCLIILIVPVLSFAAASLTMPILMQRGLVPQDLLFTPQLPDWLWYSPVLAQSIHFLFVRYGIAATLMLTFAFILIIGGFFSVLYAFVYRMVGPSRYGPLDAPPTKVKIKKYKR